MARGITIHDFLFDGTKDSNSSGKTKPPLLVFDKRVRVLGKYPEGGNILKMPESQYNLHDQKPRHPTSIGDLPSDNPDSQESDLPSGNLDSSKFGLLSLELDINKEPLPETDRRQAECKLDELNKYYELNDCPQKCAILNLIAVYNFRLGKFMEARKRLKELLSIDPTFISALQDLITVSGHKRVSSASASALQDLITVSRHKRVLGASAKAMYEKELKDVIDRIKSESNTQEAHVVDARYLANQALAWAYDIHVDSKGTSKLEKSIGLYEKALQVGHSAVEVSERNDWMFFLASDCIRQNNISRVWEDEKQYMDKFNKTFNCLLPNLKFTEDERRLSRVFCLLGNLFSQRPRAMTDMPYIVHNSGFDHYWSTPRGCYFRAYELEANWICLNRIATVLHDENREEEAMRFIEESLMNNYWISNHETYRIRARIHLMKYNKLLRQHRSTDRRLLENAKQDLEQCIATNPYVLDMIHLAEVLHKLAWKKEIRSHDQDGLQDALQQCMDAEECQDGVQRPELHQRKALILHDLKEYDDSIRSFTQAMEFENHGTKHFNNFQYMFKGMLKRFKAKQHKPKDLLKQLSYYLEIGVEKYGNTKMIWSYFSRRYPEEILSILEDLLNSSTQSSLQLAKKCIEKFKDKKVCSSRCGKSTQSSVCCDFGERMHNISVKVSEALKTCTVENTGPPLAKALGTDEICEAPENAYHKGYKYDFFVIHDEIFNESYNVGSTSNFIYYSLLPQLEQGFCRLKGCVQGRDFEMGGTKLELICDTLKNSAKVVLLLTRKYFTNTWCRKIYNIIYDGDHEQKIVPILRENIDAKDLPHGLRHKQCLRAIRPDWSYIKKQLRR